MLKTALVTGGAGGIGEAICRRLAADGYAVIINYHHSQKKAEALAEELHATALGFDVSDNTETTTAIEKTGKKHPKRATRCIFHRMALLPVNLKFHLDYLLSRLFSDSSRLYDPLFCFPSLFMLENRSFLLLLNL